MRAIILLFIVSLFGLSIISCGQATEQSPRFYVNDRVYLLNQEQKGKLETEIKELQDSIGSQISILIIETLKGEKIEDYSLKVAEEWGIGRKNYNDGVLITVVVSDRQMRIEVGTGLEKILRDEITAKILREEMIPNFKQEKYYEGLSSAIRQIKSLLKDNKDLIGQ